MDDGDAVDGRRESDDDALVPARDSDQDEGDDSDSESGEDGDDTPHEDDDVDSLNAPTLALGGGSENSDVDGEPLSDDDEDEDETAAMPSGSNGVAGDDPVCVRFGAGKFCDGRGCSPCYQALYGYLNFETPKNKKRSMDEAMSVPKAPKKDAATWHIVELVLLVDLE